MPRATAAALIALALAGGAVACKRTSATAADGGTPSSRLVATLTSLVEFEGEIEMTSTTAHTPSGGNKMTYTLKKRKMRVEVAQPGALCVVMLADAADKKIFFLVPSSKSYLEVPRSPASTAAAPSTPKPVATKSGKTDKIAGCSCEEWQVIDPTTKSRALFCVASGFSFIGLGATPMHEMLGTGPWMDAMGVSGFPLRTQTFDPSGVKISTVEATRIDQKEEPDSLFEIPSGYTLGTWPPMTL